MPLSYHYVGRIQIAIVICVLVSTTSTQTITGLTPTPPQIPAPYTSSSTPISPAPPLQQAVQTFGLAPLAYQTLLFSLLEPALSAISQATAISTATIKNADVAETSLANTSLSINRNSTTEGLIHKPPMDESSSNSSAAKDYLSRTPLKVSKASDSTESLMAPSPSFPYYQNFRSAPARVFPSLGKHLLHWSRRQIFIGCLDSLRMITYTRESRLDESTRPSGLSASTISSLAKTLEQSVPAGEFAPSYVSTMSTVTLGPNTTKPSNSSSEACPISTSAIVGNSTISNASTTPTSVSMSSVHEGINTQTNGTLVYLRPEAAEVHISATSW
ncbi:MAG: hypothetical protein M1824_002671 [Vezdaea acicularis]|nr:MAG: hypothetical protein M1824_002671 [Vezdaea acicularis]